MLVMGYSICATEPQQGIIELNRLHEFLLEFAFQPNVDQDVMLHMIKHCMKQDDAIRSMHTWQLHDGTTINVSILDFSLISLKCQEKLLTMLLAQHNQMVGLEDAYAQYEREQMFVDALRTAGIEQYLTDTEVEHYADRMLEGLSAQLFAQLCDMINENEQ